MLKLSSHGGGVQSTALMVLAGLGEVDVEHLVFSNVGDDSEAPETLHYLDEVARPWAEGHGLRLHAVQRRDRRGQPFASVRQHVLGPGRSIVIPVRMANGAPGRRQCTDRWKIAVVQRWCRENGATADAPATVSVGFSTDEAWRVSNRTQAPYERLAYPLLDLGLSRADCARIITDAGLPVPVKSACTFCPFRLPEEFVEMAERDPERFAQVLEVERGANAKRAAIGKDPVYLTRMGRPLDQVVAMRGHQLPLALYTEDEGYRCGDVCDT